MVPPMVTPYVVGPGQPYVSEANMNVQSMLYSAHTNKQFIEVASKNGEVYYLVIDYDKPIDEAGELYETYFLNTVDDRDLLAVLEEDEIPTPTPTVTPTTAPTPVPVVQPEPEPERLVKHDQMIGDLPAGDGKFLLELQAAALRSGLSNRKAARTSGSPLKMSMTIWRTKKMMRSSMINAKENICYA